MGLNWVAFAGFNWTVNGLSATTEKVLSLVGNNSNSDGSSTQSKDFPFDFYLQSWEREDTPQNQLSQDWSYIIRMASSKPRMCCRVHVSRARVIWRYWGCRHAFFACGTHRSRLLPETITILWEGFSCILEMYEHSINSLFGEVPKPHTPTTQGLANPCQPLVLWCMLESPLSHESPLPLLSYSVFQSVGQAHLPNIFTSHKRTL